MYTTRTNYYQVKKPEPPLENFPVDIDVEGSNNTHNIKLLYAYALAYPTHTIKRKGRRLYLLEADPSKN